MVFPKPIKEEYGDEIFLLPNYDGNNEPLYLFKKYKNENGVVKREQNALFEKDEYTLGISRDGICIVASCDEGFFRAVTSLSHILRKCGNKLPFCKIYDKPDFKRRSYMLDISRCRIPKVQTLERLIDLLADLKYNEFQLYMEGFVFKFKNFPEYTADFDCLTPEDIVRLDKYCEERFIDLVPNQNSLGHMGKWVQKEENKHLALSNGDDISGTLNPLLPETLEFMDKIYDSLLPYFSSEYVNIGLDEAYGLGKFQIEKECLKKGTDNVFMDYLNKLNDMIKEKYGKKVMFWADMVYDYPNAYTRVPKDAIALNWGYDYIKTAMMEKRCIDLLEKGTKYYICPGNCTWISFTGRFDVMSFNLRTCGELGRKYGAEGYMLTDWGCGEGHMHFPVWSLVPCALGAQYSWNVGEEQNGGTFKADYIRAAQNYIDGRYFGGKRISASLYKLQQYYLLEPERIHSSTMCCFIFRKPLSETAYEPFFDLKECGDDFYFDNIIYYMKKALSEIKDIEFDKKLKRQIFCNSEMVILSAELCKIRMSGSVSKEKKKELISMCDEIADEYTALWKLDNYEEGLNHFRSQIYDRKNDLLNM